MMRPLLAFCAAFVVLLALPASAEWMQWRGPNLNGSSDAKNLPEKLDDSTQVWKAKLPGIGASTPVVAGDHAFLTVFDPASRKLMALTYSLADGKLLWSREMGLGRSNNMNNLSSCSAVTDGSQVIFYFGSGDLAAFDLAGKELWSRNLQTDYGTFNYQWLYGSSPLLWDGKMYIQVLHRDIPASQWRAPREGEKTFASYILCIDPSNGKTLWKHDRPTNARVESHESYATPIPYDVNGLKQLLVVGGDCVTGHDPQTGEEIWRAGGWNPQKIEHWRIVPSPVVADGLVIICAPKRGPVMGYRPGKGEVTQSNTVWRSTEFSSDVPTPLYYQGNLYVLDGDFQKGLSCVDPATGKRKWQTRIGSRSVLRGSPTGADGKIYCNNESGEQFVLSASDGKLIWQGKLEAGAPSRTSVVALDGKILVRTADHLYLFGNK